MYKNVYKQDLKKIFSQLKTTSKGLSSTEAKERLALHGENSLETKTSIKPFKIFISQFQDFIIYILFFAVIISLLMKEYVDAIIILVILLANAIIGFIQEYRAQVSMESLKKMDKVDTRVYRDGKFLKLPSNQLVPGDVIHLEAGDKVPADLRIIESVRLKVDESLLTGESVPADKKSGVIRREAQISDQWNTLFSSTSVVSGTAKAVVTSTGMNTEIGKITTLIKDAKVEMTPLQRRLDSFGKKVGIVIIAICVLVFFMILFRSGNIDTTILAATAMIAISLAVAAVPTALPVVITIALSIGVKKLLNKKCLVKNLSSVETLGSCDVICTDKTGTLTKNEMTVRNAWTIDSEAVFTGLGYGEGTVKGKIDDIVYEIGLVCNDSSLENKNGRWIITGDPTEAALLTSAMKAGISSKAERLDELPFDSDRKMMSVLISKGKEKLVYVKGAPDKIIDKCSQVLIKGKAVKMTATHKKNIKRAYESYASNALRVLAFAYKKSSKIEENNLVFAGLQAMIDPPREEVVESIKKAKDAGIRIIMITGDNVNTAAAIGKEVGIEGKALIGSAIDTMTDEELSKALIDTNIFARVVPEHKQRIITLLQKMKHTVAMSGDGVNDAPALRKSDIGVAVGSGTDVAKEASDFVLLDDGFSHIVNAVEEGRGIYDNIQKSIMLLLSGNIGEVLIIFLAIIFGFNLPLTAILLLWINLVTDGAPAIAYGFDPYGKDIMKRKPRPYHESILPKAKMILVLFLGMIGTVIALYLFEIFGGNSTTGHTAGQTAVFNFIVLYELLLVFIIRSDYHVPFYKNKWIWGSVILSVLLQAILMYTPLNEEFGIIPLSFANITTILLGGAIFYLAYLAYYYLIHKQFFTR